MKDRAIKTTRQKGARTIGLTAGSGGKLAEFADPTLRVPSESTPRIPEAHITTGHITGELVAAELSSTG